MADWTPDGARPIVDAGWKPDGARELALDTRAPVHVDPLEGVSWPERAFRGLEYGLGNTVLSALDLAKSAVGFGAAPTAQPAGWSDAAGTYKTLHDNEGGWRKTFRVPLLSDIAGDFTASPGSIGNLVGETVASAPAATIGGGMANEALRSLGANPAALNGIARLAALGATRAAEGGAQGAVLAGPDHRLAGLTLGALLSGAGGMAFDVAGNAARGFINPTPEAAALLGRGVPLSTGQLDPHGALNTTEQAGSHSVLGGTAINAARSAGARGWQDLALGEVGAPGFQVAPGSSLEDAFAQARESFKPAYDPIHGTPVPASIKGVKTADIIREAFRQATEDKGVMASRATRETVNDFLQNQASKIDDVRTFKAPGQAAPEASAGVAGEPNASATMAPPLMASSDLGIQAPISRWAETPLSEATGAARPKAMPVLQDELMTAAPLLNVRSAIRQAARAVEGQPGVDAAAHAALLNNAEGLLTSAIEKRLTPEAAEFLRATDARYAQLNQLEAAQKLAKLGEAGFTPEQLARIKLKGASAADVASGLRGDNLADIARLGRAVFENKAPNNGALPLKVPFGLAHLAGPIGALIQRPGVRAFLLGDLATQAGARSAADTIGGLVPNMLKRGDFSAGPNALLAPLEIQQR